MLSVFPVLTEYVLQPDIMCGHTLGLCNESPYQITDIDKYINHMLDSKPAYLASNDYIDQLYLDMDNDNNDRPYITVV
jgi:hypothetical protein